MISKIPIGIISRQASSDSSYWVMYPQNANVFSAGVDSSENIYLGTWSSSGTTISTTTKIDQSGEVIWQIDKTGQNQGALDSSGNQYYVYVDPYGSPAPITATLFKISASGATIWKKKLSITSLPYYAKAKTFISPSGHIYVIINYLATSTTILMMKFDSSGANIWQKTISDSSAISAYAGLEGVGFDSSSNIYLSISTSQYTYINPPGIWMNAPTAATISINIDGFINWQIEMTGLSLIGGSALILTDGSLLSAYCGNLETVLVKHSQYGALMSQRSIVSIPSSARQGGYDAKLSKDDAGNVYLLLHVNDNSSGSYAGPYYVVLIKFDPTATNIIWQRKFLISRDGYAPNEPNGGGVAGWIKTSGQNMYVSVAKSFQSSTTTFGGYLFKLPIDGSLAGFTARINSDKISYSSGTFISQANSSYTITTPSFVSNDASFQISDGTLPIMSTSSQSFIKENLL